MARIAGVNIPTGKRVSASVAKVLAAHGQASANGLTRGAGAVAGDSRFEDMESCC